MLSARAETRAAQPNGGGGGGVPGTTVRRLMADVSLGWPTEQAEHVTCRPEPVLFSRLPPDALGDLVPFCSCVRSPAGPRTSPVT